MCGCSPGIGTRNNYLSPCNLFRGWSRPEAKIQGTRSPSHSHPVLWGNGSFESHFKRAVESRLASLMNGREWFRLVAGGVRAPMIYKLLAQVATWRPRRILSVQQAGLPCRWIEAEGMADSVTRALLKPTKPLIKARNHSLSPFEPPKTRSKTLFWVVLAADPWGFRSPNRFPKYPSESHVRNERTGLWI